MVLNENLPLLYNNHLLCNSKIRLLEELVYTSSFFYVCLIIFLISILKFSMVYICIWVVSRVRFFWVFLSEKRKWIITKNIKSRGPTMYCLNTAVLLWVYIIIPLFIILTLRVFHHKLCWIQKYGTILSLWKIDGIRIGLL